MTPHLDSSSELKKKSASQLQTPWRVRVWRLISSARFGTSCSLRMGCFSVVLRVVMDPQVNSSWWCQGSYIARSYIQELHGEAIGGHLSEEKTLNWLKERFYHSQGTGSMCRTGAGSALVVQQERHPPLGNLQHSRAFIQGTQCSWWQWTSCPPHLQVTQKTATSSWLLLLYMWDGSLSIRKLQLWPECLSTDFSPKATTLRPEQAVWVRSITGDQQTSAYQERPVSLPITPRVMATWRGSIVEHAGYWSCRQSEQVQLGSLPS